MHERNEIVPDQSASVTGDGSGNMSFATEWPLPRAALREGEHPPDSQPSEEHTTLQASKQKVPAYIARFGKERWCQRVDRVDAGAFARDRVSVVSRAYHKMHEMFESCALPYPRRSLHLCEAPGGFIQWLSNHHPNPDEWTWQAMSLTGGPSFDAPRLPTHRGRAFEGDVLDVDRWKRELSEGSFDLVTADGATAMDHNDMEREHLSLLWAQGVVAVHCLALEGNLLLKFFEGGLYETQVFIAMMTRMFHNVSIIKPMTSRPTNSERYLICRRLRSRGLTRNDNLVVSSAWLKALGGVLDRLSRYQTQRLEAVFAELDGGLPAPRQGGP